MRTSLWRLDSVTLQISGAPFIVGRTGRLTRLGRSRPRSYGRSIRQRRNAFVFSLIARSHGTALTTPVEAIGYEDEAIQKRKTGLLRFARNDDDMRAVSFREDSLFDHRTIAFGQRPEGLVGRNCRRQ